MCFGTESPISRYALRITRNSDRTRASDRTMWTLKTPGLACQPCHTRLASSPSADEPRSDRKPARAKPLARIGGILTAVGWISRQNLLASGRGGAFSLTSLFIELVEALCCCFRGRAFLSRAVLRNSPTMRYTSESGHDTSLPAQNGMEGTVPSLVLSEMHPRFCFHGLCEHSRPLVKVIPHGT